MATGCFVFSPHWAFTLESPCSSSLHSFTKIIMLAHGVCSQVKTQIISLGKKSLITQITYSSIRILFLCSKAMFAGICLHLKLLSSNHRLSGKLSQLKFQKLLKSSNIYILINLLGFYSMVQCGSTACPGSVWLYLFLLVPRLYSLVHYLCSISSHS